MLITLICKRCGKEFQEYPSEAPRRKYCSLACANASVTKICLKCGKKFNGQPAYMAKRNYCSVSCAKKKNKVKLICKKCGKIYWRSPSLMQKSKYCSRKCMSNRIRYTCEMCGKIREVPASSTAKRFCGNKCRLKWFAIQFKGKNSPHWKGGELPYYGPNWRQQRNKARYRDKHRCQHCNKHQDELNEKLSVAHIISFRDSKNYKEANKLSNLISLCRKCHTRFDWENGTRN